MKPIKRHTLLLSLLCLLTTPVQSAESSATTQSAEPALPLEDVRLFADIFGAIKNYYVDTVTDKKLIENAIKGMVSGLDPHSSFLDAKAFKDMQESTAGEFGGLGIEITKDPQGVRVVSPIDDTPAAKAGVMAGDIIIKIDGKLASDRTLDQNVKLMRGKPNTDITLTIARKGLVKPLVIKLTRAIIKIHSVKHKTLSDGLGYIRISQFQERTTEDLVKAFNDLQKSGKLKGLVLDLRNNPGGLLNAAIGVSAAFLPKDTPIVSTRGRDKTQETIYTAVERHYAVGKERRDPLKGLSSDAKTIPIVVLINPASASASEIVSGALQDHKRATIMGSRSFGKGSVQSVLPLRLIKEETLGVKITTARYYTPSGRSIQAKGITPDIAVDDTPQGNYPSFNIREADLAGHIEVADGKKDQTKETDEESDIESIPTLKYMFGDDKDFPLQQAIAHLSGKKVITHADIQKELKAKKDSQKKDSK